MSTDEQPIPGPDQMKPQRRFEETGSADEAPHERCAASEASCKRRKDFSPNPAAAGLTSS